MIEVHLDDDFMQEQYEYRKKELAGQLVEKLNAYKIDVKNAAA